VNDKTQHGATVIVDGQVLDAQRLNLDRAGQVRSLKSPHTAPSGTCSFVKGVGAQHGRCGKQRDAETGDRGRSVVEERGHRGDQEEPSQDNQLDADGDE
jgi:hypothetical protein